MVHIDDIDKNNVNKILKDVIPKTEYKMRLRLE